MRVPKIRIAGLSALLFFLVLGFSLLGCHTIEGIGKDIEQVGNSIKEALR